MNTFAVNIDVVNISENVTPLAAGAAAAGAWALVNLVFVLMGILLAVVTLALVIPLLRRKKDGSNVLHRSIGARVSLIGFGLTAAIALAAAALFFVTEKLFGAQVLIDEWTLVHAVLIALEVAAAAATLVLSTGREEEVLVPADQ